ncbi:class I SAM-dependent methyltransferase [Tundrisphaera lichenicola]|uniref:class I SAM-dependent methyltransferase n=1 Tax=Tundrisphaera lichenicola TaxID=2029860 RepID=UPI003EBC589A
MTIICPRCGSIPEGGPERWSCPGCEATYPGLRGIIDLRTSEDAFLSNREDWDYARGLDADFDRLDFRGLLDRYFDLSPEIPAHLRRRQIEHIRTAPDRVRAWLDSLGLPEDAGPLLDLGCGSGSFLSAVGGSGREVAGVDIALRWLMVARKRLDEEGFAHIKLACGCAERLPFADESFAGVVAGDVIEHVDDQAATLAEAHRVLRPGGRLFLASPNRFSLAPEPHVQVWGVGFLPRAWMARYVRSVNNEDFRAIRTLGFGEWKRLIRRSPFKRGDLIAPGLPEADLVAFGPIKKGLARVYNRTVASRTGQVAAKAVGPLFHVVCVKEGESASAPMDDR